MKKYQKYYMLRYTKFYPSHINFDMRKVHQFHQFETGCTNLYTANALEVYKYVHLIFKVHKFVHPVFVVQTFWKNEVYKLYTL